MIRNIAAIAATEMRIAMRNRWIITATALMTGFGLILAFAGSAPSGMLGVDRLTITITSLSTLSVYLVPLIALLLSFDAFAGETDRGTLQLLVTYPVERWQILVGKFSAQLAVLTLAVVVGFGITTGAVWAADGVAEESLAHLVRLTLTASLLGAGFLAVGNCISASVRQPGTAASLAIAVWVVAVVMFDVILLGAVVADDGGVFTKDIFPWLLVVSPTDAFRLFNLAAIESGVAAEGLAATTENFVVPAMAPLVSLVLWPFAILSLAAYVLRRFEP
jgi:Cu-processing system permease protein